MTPIKPTSEGIQKAKKVLENVIETTPLKLNEQLSDEFGAKIYLKRDGSLNISNDIESFELMRL